MQRELVEERNAFQEDRVQMERLLNEATARAERAERQVHEARTEREGSVVQEQQHHARALRMAEDRLAQTMALLDEREEQAKNLKAMVQTLQSKMAEHDKGAKHAERELDELHNENEALHDHIDKLEAQSSEFQAKIKKLQVEADKVSHLKVRKLEVRESGWLLP
jgi:chromosome segregation ATPase